jgi:kinetochore protein NDC80
MDEHKAALEQKVKERSAELQETNGRLNKMTAHVEELKRTIESQELSVDDVETMESDLKGLSEALDRSIALRDQRRKTLSLSESELLVACNNLELTIVEYNAKLLDLQLVPRGLGSGLANLKATLHKDSLLESDQSKIVGVDWLRTVRPTVEKVRTNFTKEVEEAKSAIQDALDKVESSNDALTAAQGKLQIFQDKLVKCEKTLESERETHCAKFAVRQREVEAMERKVAVRRDPVALEEQMAAYERQCAELEALRLEHEENSVTKKRAAQNEIQQACTLFVESELYFERKLRELGEYWQAKQSKMSKIKVPPNVKLEG